MTQVVNIRLVLIALILCQILVGNVSVAQQCIRGNPKDRRLIDRINSQKDMLTLKFRNSLQLEKGAATKADSFCINDYDFKFYRISAAQAASRFRDGQAIKKQCVLASMQRAVEKKSFVCNSNRRPAQIEDEIPCVDDYVANYVRFALNEGIRCVSATIGRIDPDVILKKINNESGFMYFLGDKYGVGLGQLTSDPIKDLLGYNINNKYEEGNGRSIIERLANSKDEHCAVFKPILRNDLKSKKDPAPAMEVCRWLDSGDGLARNIIYSLAYFSYLQTKVIPSIVGTDSAVAKYPEVINQLALVAYGPEGRVLASKIATKINQKSWSQQRMLQAIQKESQYLKDTDEKYKELLVLASKKEGPKVYKTHFSCVE